MFDRGYIKDLARRRLGYGGQGSAIAVLLIAMLLGAVDGAVKLRIHYRVEDNTDRRTVVIRSHGVPRSLYDRLAELGMDYVAATCP